MAISKNINIIARFIDKTKKGVDSTKKGMGGLADSAKKLVSKALTPLALSLASIAAIRLSIGLITDFSTLDTAIRSAAAVTGKFTEAFGKFSEAAKYYGETTNKTSLQAANSLKKLAQSGLDVTESITALPTVLNLSTSSGEDLADVADILTNIVAQFGLSVDELPYVADRLTKTFTSSNTSLKELGDGFSYVGPIAKAAGYSFESTLAILGNLANAGFKAERGGTALRGGIAALANTTPEASAVLDELGVKVKTSSGEMRAFEDIIDDLNKAVPTVGQTLKIFGKIAGPGMAALIAQGSEGIRELTEEIIAAGGFNKQVADDMSSGIGGQLALLTSKYDALAKAMGEEMADSAISGSKTAIEVMDAVTDTVAGVAGSFFEIVVAVFQFVASLENVGTVLGFTIDVVSFLISSIATGITTLEWLFDLVTFQFDNADDALNRVANSGRKTGKAFEKLYSNWDDSNEKVNDLNESTKNFNETTDDTAKKQRELKAEMAAAVLEMEKQEAKLKVLEESFKKVKESLVLDATLQKDQLQRSLDLQKQNLDAQLLAIDAKNISETEKNRLKNEAILAENQSSLVQTVAVLENNLAAIEAVYNNEIESFSGAKEKQKILEKELADKRLEILLEIEGSYETSINTLISLDKKHRDKAISFQQEILGIEKSRNEKLRELDRIGLSDIEASESKKKQLAQDTADVKRLIRKGEFAEAKELSKKNEALAFELASSEKQFILDKKKTAEDYNKAVVAYEEHAAKVDKLRSAGKIDAAEKLAESGKRLAKSVADAEEKAKEKSVASSSRYSKARSDYNNAVDLTTKALERASAEEIKKADAAKNSAQVQKEELEKVRESITSVSDAIKEASTLTIETDYSSVDAAKKAIDEIPTDKHVTIHTTTVEGRQEGGILGVVKRAAGGSIPDFIKRARGKLAGFGGGDKIKLLAEAGEYVTNKFIVRDQGKNKFDALNKGLADIVIRRNNGGEVNFSEKINHSLQSISRPSSSDSSFNPSSNINSKPLANFNLNIGDSVMNASATQDQFSLFMRDLELKKRGARRA